MDLMALADGQRGGAYGRFESRFLGREIAFDIAVVQHAPARAYGDDGVLGKSHRRAPHLLPDFWPDSMLLSGILSRPWSPLSSLPPEVEVPLPLGLDLMELPVVDEAPVVAVLAAGSPVVELRALGPAWASARLAESKTAKAAIKAARFISSILLPAETNRRARIGS